MLISEDTNGISASNPRYSNAVFSPEISEDPLYVNAMVDDVKNSDVNAIANDVGQSDANIYDNQTEKDQSAALYGNVDISQDVQSQAAGGEYESVAIKPFHDVSDNNADVYECLRKQSKPETSLYTRLQFQNSNQVSQRTPSKEMSKGKK